MASRDAPARALTSRDASAAPLMSSDASLSLSSMTSLCARREFGLKLSNFGVLDVVSSLVLRLRPDTRSPVERLRGTVRTPGLCEFRGALCLLPAVGLLPSIVKGGHVELMDGVGLLPCSIRRVSFAAVVWVLSSKMVTELRRTNTPWSGLH